MSAFNKATGIYSAKLGLYMYAIAMQMVIGYFLLLCSPNKLNVGGIVRARTIQDFKDIGFDIMQGAGVVHILLSIITFALLILAHFVTSCFKLPMLVVTIVQTAYCSMTAGFCALYLQRGYDSITNIIKVVAKKVVEGYDPKLNELLVDNRNALFAIGMLAVLATSFLHKAQVVKGTDSPTQVMIVIPCISLGLAVSFGLSAPCRDYRTFTLGFFWALVCISGDVISSVSRFFCFKPFKILMLAVYASIVLLSVITIGVCTKVYTSGRIDYSGYLDVVHAAHTKSPSNKTEDKYNALPQPTASNIQRNEPETRSYHNKNTTAREISLGETLNAKWRRLTEKRQQDNEEKNEDGYPNKRPVTQSHEQDVTYDDYMDLKHLLGVTIKAKPNVYPRPSSGSSTDDDEGGGGGGRSSGRASTQHSQEPTITSVFNMLEQNNRNRRENGQTNIEKFETKTHTRSAKNDNTWPEHPVISMMNGYASNDTTDVTTRDSAKIQRNDVINSRNTVSSETADIERELDIQGVVALVLHSENAFHVAYQKGTSNNPSMWKHILPPQLFNYLTALNCGLKVARGNKETYIVFPAQSYGTVLKGLRKVINKTQCAVDPIPNFILKTFPAFNQFARNVNLPQKTQDIIAGQVCEYTRKNMEKIPEIVGQSLYTQLKPFQCEGLNFGIRKNGRVLIGDEMGLGKTLQALAISAFYWIDWPLLIVCPSSLRFQWRDECIKWLPHLINEYDVCTVKNGKMAIPDHTKVVIISYDLYVLNQHFRHKFRTVICDESHYLKNQHAKRTKCLAPLLKEAERTILLSGTPSLNSPSELFEQISCLMPAFCSENTFIERYCQKKLNWYSKRMTYSGSQHSSELHLFLVRTVMIRRLKENVLHELPPKIRSKVPIELPKAFLRESKQYMENLEQAGVSEDDQFLASSQAMFKLTGEAKINGIREYLVHMLKTDIKFIVFAHHLAVMDAIEDTLQQQKTKYIRIDGNTQQAKREENVNCFQNDTQYKVALLSITACGVGLNLTASSTVVFAELHWVPGQMIQAEDRAHRMGTKHRVINVYYLIAENSVDETMWRTVNRKWEAVTATLNGETSHLTLTKESERAKVNELSKQYKITDIMN
ncbi:DNA annealing helicase and endonuclease ZRANB3 [Babesia sp. Xinjiang]|uniref:DNA annealing helicase and endonuclease ZRANB3 n=1 Tax=Babesia sp. Xinjiang TaxID=462227 RepID=UPI000A22E7F8|nr:DNA annealing helicase and endonuclease ZRANB3 [Babesia sp. Xinjiang]ORM40042.1 DNA annealing helicase and endonuclease ZRANB3 [Babesia sp. Xinjiang]